MLRSLKIFICFTAIIAFNCTKPTKPDDNDNTVSKYENHYNILFQRGNNIYTIHSDGTDLFRITNTDSYKQDAIFSPDGSKIAFSSGDGLNLHVYIMDSNGANLLKLSHYLGWNLRPQFTPDGNKIIFVHELYLSIVNIDGSNFNEFPTVLSEYCVHPFTNKVLYDHCISDSGYIYEFDIDNASTRRLINTSYWIGDPVYSPDGLKIAFASNKNWQCDLFLMNVDGSNLVKVTNLSYLNQLLYLVWSPDNSKILYRYWDDVDDGSLYMINIDGSNLVKIADFGGNQSWAPDMTRISYGIFDDDSEYGASIIIYDIETEVNTKLTDGVGAVWSKVKL